MVLSNVMIIIKALWIKILSINIFIAVKTTYTKKAHSSKSMRDGLSNYISISIFK
jgi:hypothetical protein